MVNPPLATVQTMFVRMDMPVLMVSVALVMAQFTFHFYKIANKQCLSAVCPNGQPSIGSCTNGACSLGYTCIFGNICCASTTSRMLHISQHNIKLYCRIREPIKIRIPINIFVIHPMDQRNFDMTQEFYRFPIL